MDIFKQKRYLWIAVIVLVVINIAALTLLWMGRPDGRGPKVRHLNPVEEQNRIQYLLEKELGFDANQTEQYLNIFKKFYNNIYCPCIPNQLISNIIFLVYGQG